MTLFVQYCAFMLVVYTNGEGNLTRFVYIISGLVARNLMLVFVEPWTYTTQNVGYSSETYARVQSVQF